MHHRAYADPSRWRGGNVVLGASATHHLATVLRAAPGDRVAVFDGRGREADAALETIQDGEARLRVIDERRAHERGPHISLYASIPKGKRMDWLVEKAVEIGVADIVPVHAARGIVRLSGTHATERARRWQRVALSAAKQCGAAWLPGVRQPVGLAQLRRELESQDLLLLACQCAEAEPLRAVLRRVREHGPSRVGLLVGPEGDWTENERALLVSTGATVVSYGERVLRVETAALFGLATIVYELDNPPDGRAKG